MPIVPSFNYDCLPRTQRPWIEDISERMQCPPDFPAIGATIALCSLIGRKIGIRPKRFDDWLLIPNLWGCVVGPPGVMKTPGLQQVMAALRRLVALAFTQYEAKLRDYKIKLMLRTARKKVVETEIGQALRDEDSDTAREKAESFLQEEEEQPICRRHEINDSSVEKLGVILSENPNGVLLFRDELSGLWRSLDREERAGERAIYLETWDGLGEFVYDRIGRGTVRIPSNTLSMLGGTTPDLLMRYVRETVHGGIGNDGFLQRYQLFAWPDISREFRNVDRWPDTKVKNEAFAVFKYLDELRPEDVAACMEDGIPFLRFALDAQELFDSWRVELEKKLRGGNEHPAFLAHLAKYRKLIPALALFIHLADRKTGPVSLDALSRSLLWGTDLEAHARRIYSGVLHSDTIAARQLAKHLQQGDLSARFTQREVHRKDWTGLTEKDDVESATEILCELGWIRLDVEASRKVPGTPGRSPSPTFAVNPRILKYPYPPTVKTDKTNSVSIVGDPLGVSAKSEEPCGPGIVPPPSAAAAVEKGVGEI
jgi:putative DNA primase/helicase